MLNPLNKIQHDDCRAVAKPKPGPKQPRESCQGIFSGVGPLALTSAAKQQKSEFLARVRQGTSGRRADQTIVGSAAFPPPPQCAADFSQTDVVSNPDRFTTCSSTGWYAETWVTDSSGDTEVTGEMSFQDYQWVSYNTSPAGTWIHGLVILAPISWGTLAETGTPLTVSNLCDTNQTACLSVPEAMDGISVGDGTLNDYTTLSEHDFAWQGFDNGTAASTASSVDYLDGFLGIWVDSPTWDAGFIDNGSFDGQGSVMVGRCDTVLTTTDTCVNEDNVPTLTYDSTQYPLVAPVAQHIYTAQKTLPIAWGVPGGSMLTRDMNPADNTANNAVACANIPTTPGVTNCDEFPMASTHQGASFLAIGYWSAVAVPVAANSSQGGLTAAFYSSNRVMDGDAFYVLAILPDGTPSW
jgi:hypothetical protein